MSKQVYFFGNQRAEGAKDMRLVLGGKGANLAEMTNIGVPVPPGFTIACGVCMQYLQGGGVDGALRERKPPVSGSATRAIRCSSRSGRARPRPCRG